MSKLAGAAFAAIALSMLSPSAQGGLILNGEFNSSLTFSQSIYNQVVPWVVSPDNARVYLYLPGTATTTGATYTHGAGAQVVLTGTGDDSDPFNGNGNFVGIDSGFATPISQTITGLLPNTQYVLTFDTAASQQTIASGGVGGATTDYWQVSLDSTVEYLCGGGSEQGTACSVPLFSIASQGYSGWYQEEMTFTTPSTLTTGALTFLAVGSPSGDPPFMLLDSVNLQAAPEPATYAFIGVGVGGILAVRRRINKRR